MPLCETLVSKVCNDNNHDDLLQITYESLIKAIDLYLKKNNKNIYLKNYLKQKIQYAIDKEIKFYPSDRIKKIIDDPVAIYGNVVRDIFYKIKELKVDDFKDLILYSDLDGLDDSHSIVTNRKM